MSLHSAILGLFLPMNLTNVIFYFTCTCQDFGTWTLFKLFCSPCTCDIPLCFREYTQCGHCPISVRAYQDHSF
ncbi:hypothetical protein B0H14DRAFT_2768382 [Mycena olivaceomarginata]|nr:hypothetical protein B0H14DRAFT_2768382 [Mycena olivaceomarginata]